MAELIGCGRAWFLPVLIFRSNDDWGHAKGPFIYLPERVDKPFEKHALYHHEIWHVKQWLAIRLAPFIAGVVAAWHLGEPGFVALFAAIIGPIIIWRKQKHRIEASAYAESVRRGYPIDRAATAMTNATYPFKVTKEGAKSLIKEYLDSGRLI